MEELKKEIYNYCELLWHYGLMKAEFASYSFVSASKEISDEEFIAKWYLSSYPVHAEEISIHIRPTTKVTDECALKGILITLKNKYGLDLSQKQEDERFENLKKIKEQEETLDKYRKIGCG